MKAGAKFTTATLFHPTILLALALMGVILMMVLPVPAWVLDIGLAISFALAILMLTVTLFIERPLELIVINIQVHGNLPDAVIDRSKLLDVVKLFGA